MKRCGHRHREGAWEGAGPERVQGREGGGREGQRSEAMRVGQCLSVSRAALSDLPAPSPCAQRNVPSRGQPSPAHPRCDGWRGRRRPGRRIKPSPIPRPSARGWWGREWTRSALAPDRNLSAPHELLQPDSALLLHIIRQRHPSPLHPVGRLTPLHIEAGNNPVVLLDRAPQGVFFSGPNHIDSMFVAYNRFKYARAKTNLTIFQHKLSIFIKWQCSKNCAFDRDLGLCTSLEGVQSGYKEVKYDQTLPATPSRSFYRPQNQLVAIAARRISPSTLPGFAMKAGPAPGLTNGCALKYSGEVPELRAASLRACP